MIKFIYLSYYQVKMVNLHTILKSHKPARQSLTDLELNTIYSLVERLTIFPYSQHDFNELHKFCLDILKTKGIKIRHFPPHLHYTSPDSNEPSLDYETDFLSDKLVISRFREEEVDITTLKRKRGGQIMSLDDRLDRAAKVARGIYSWSNLRRFFSYEPSNIDICRGFNSPQETWTSYNYEINQRHV